MTSSTCRTTPGFPGITAVVVAIVFSCGSWPLAGQDVDVPERLRYERVEGGHVDILRMIAARAQENYKQIRTWRAEYRFQDRQVFPAGDTQEAVRTALKQQTGVELAGRRLYRIVSGTVEIELDTAADAFFSRYHATTAWLPDESGRALVTLDRTRPALPLGDGTSLRLLMTHNAVVTPREYLHMEPDAQLPRLQVRPHTGPVRGRVAYREPARAAFGQHWALVVDPRYLFGEYLEPGWKLAERFADTLEALASENLPQDRGWEELKAARPRLIIRRAETDSGPVFAIRLQLHPAPGETLMADYRFDGRVGFNLIQSKITEPGGRVSSYTTWEYVSQDDVFIPKSLIRTQALPDSDRLQFQRNLDLVTARVNRPLHPAGFSYQRLGLQDGERVYDRIEEVLYTLQNGELVPVPEGNAPVPDQKEARFDGDRGRSR